MAQRLLLNIIGGPASGKGTACRYLVESCGFSDSFSPSSHIRDYAQARGIKLGSRKDFSACHDEMTAEDPDAFVKPIVQKVGDIALDGIRVPNNLLKLKPHGRLAIVAFECAAEERFRRAMAARDERGGKDRTTLDAFLADEAGDNYSSDPSKASVKTVMEMADLTIDTTYQSEAETIGELAEFVASLRTFRK